MRRILLAFVLVAGCGGSGPAANEAAAPTEAARPGGASPSEGPARGGSDVSLAGLWAGGSAAHRDQLCMVERKGKTQFGVVVWGANLSSCSGAGEAERTGDSLTLRMTGDSACTIVAAIAGGKIAFRRADGPGCADYYCGRAARFDGAAFVKEGTGDSAARKAIDIAGDPLCG
jgi:hypothetical protein